MQRLAVDSVIVRIASNLYILLILLAFVSIRQTLSFSAPAVFGPQWVQIRRSSLSSSGLPISDSPTARIGDVFRGWIGTRHATSSLSSYRKADEYDFESQSQYTIGGNPQRSPTPVMPSQLFQELALSQLELLASSVLTDAQDNENDVEGDASSDASTGPNSGGASGIGAGKSKIKSMAVYLPQENCFTGQLEFIPGVIYPHPKKERVFIANDSDSGMAPEIPTILTKLPGFAHAASLLPGYPMVSMPGQPDKAGVGVVEEVLCDVKSGGTALSVPLFSGSQTVGVLLVSPDQSKVKRRRRNGNNGSIWTEYDRQQVARAAKSISLALSMDAERSDARMQNHQVRDALSDSLHQFKNPLQALRTYGKLLQRRMAESRELTPQALELADHLMVQSDRLVERLKPVDAIVDAMMVDGEHRKRPFALNPVEAKALVPLKTSVPDPNQRPQPLSSLGHINVTDYSTQRDSPVSSFFASDDDSILDSEATEASFAGRSPPPFWSSSLLGDVNLEMAFVSDVLDPVLTVFRDIAYERGIKFIVEVSDELPGVTIWPLALQEAVINLLDNAFKYVVLSEYRPTVRVRLLSNNGPLRRRQRKRETGSLPTTGEMKSPGVTILIEDNGPGIPPADFEAVFDRGYRSGATSLVTDGSGIGLAIARELVQHMGGTLRVAEPSSHPNSLNGAVLELIVFRKNIQSLD